MEGVYEFQDLKMILAPIFRQHGVQRDFLFGSYARGEATESSDVDLKIDGGAIKSMFGLGALYEDLTAALKKPVDLVTTSALEHEANADRTKRFRANIQEDERLIYEEENN